MSGSEFDLIERYFSSLNHRDDVLLGVGDDAAVIRTASESESLVVCTDTLIEDVHFPKHTAPEDIAYKALAANLSDIAAMGALPAWVTLALTLPSVDEDWLSAFADGFAELIRAHGLSLIGGDTTRGALSITVQVIGYANERILTRQGAQSGDDLWVSGTIGDAALALKHLHQKPNEWLKYLNRPEPRITLGQQLVSVATSCIDVSDGLIADLGHILKQSQCGAEVFLDAVPLSDITASWMSQHNDWQTIVNGGDDYELLFTANPKHRELLSAESLTRIGRITEQQAGLVLLDKDKQTIELTVKGYDHFA